MGYKGNRNTRGWSCEIQYWEKNIIVIRGMFFFILRDIHKDVTVIHESFFNLLFLPSAACVKCIRKSCTKYGGGMGFVVY